MSDKTENYDLIHCIYASTESADFSHDDIIALLKKAREVNSKLGVTGMLLYDDGSFFQVLEGPSDIVSTLYEKISADKRHHRVKKIIQGPIEKRDFSDWTMGYSDITREQLSTIEGLNDFFLSNKSYTELDKGRAQKLLDAFGKGQWRVLLM